MHVHSVGKRKPGLHFLVSCSPFKSRVEGRQWSFWILCATCSICSSAPRDLARRLLAYYIFVLGCSTICSGSGMYSSEKLSGLAVDGRGTRKLARSLFQSSGSRPLS